jgi:predicted nucleic acid-binding Zn ribbon protein
LKKQPGERRSGKPQMVGSLLGQVLDELGLEVASHAFRISELWSDAVGAEVAAHSRPVGLRGGVLEVSVDSSVWCQQLQMQRREILAALSERMGSDSPRDLRFRLGYTARP